MASVPFSPPPRLLHLIGQASRSGAARAFDRAARDPVAAQHALLRSYLVRNRDTEFGRLHGFADLASDVAARRDPQAYSRSVPLQTPDDLEPWVSRLQKGERKLLTAEDPIFYGLTTGSSGKHKVVPITPSYRAEFQATVKIAFWHLFRRFPSAFKSRLLYFVGPRRFHVAPDGLDVGSMSGYNFTEQPPLVRALYAWPAELFRIENLEDRSYVALLLALLGDVSLITGVFPLPIISLLRDLETRAEELARDLQRGTLDGARNLTPAQREFFTRNLAARPDLAARVARAADAPVEEKARLAFPRLALAYCWATSTAGSYVPELRRRLGPDVPVRDAIYAATEAWCNVPLGDEDTGGPLAVTSAYFEFIPESDYEAGKCDAVPLEALRDGERYYIVVSTGAGLYRSVIGDIVETCGRYLSTPRIRFVRKTGASANLAGEQLDESHVNAAVAGVLAARGLEATWFAMVGDTGSSGTRAAGTRAADTSAADTSSADTSSAATSAADASGAHTRPGYDLLLELAPGHPGLPGSELTALCAEVEASLGRQAYNYALHQGGGRLRPLAAIVLPPGRYAAWRRRRVAAGTTEAQLKSVHLYGDRASLPDEFEPAR